jgi:hypothetical protein
LQSEVRERCLVVFLARELEQLVGFAERAIDSLHGMDDGFQRGPFAAEALSALGIRPDVPILELAAYFLQPLALRVEVKDTSARRRSARRGLEPVCRSD